MGFSARTRARLGWGTAHGKITPSAFVPPPPCAPVRCGVRAVWSRRAARVRRCSTLLAVHGGGRTWYPVGCALGQRLPVHCLVVGTYLGDACLCKGSAPGGPGECGTDRWGSLVGYSLAGVPPVKYGRARCLPECPDTPCNKGTLMLGCRQLVVHRVVLVAVLLGVAVGLACLAGGGTYCVGVQPARDVCWCCE